MPKSLAEASLGHKEFFGRRPPRASHPVRQEDSPDPSDALEWPGNLPPASSLLQRSEDQVEGRYLNTSAESGALPRRGSKRASLPEVLAANVHNSQPQSLNAMAPAFEPSRRPNPVDTTEERGSKKRERRASGDAASEHEAMQSPALPVDSAVISKKPKGKADRLIKRQELRAAEALVLQQQHLESEIKRQESIAAEALALQQQHLESERLRVSTANKKKKSRRQEVLKAKADEEEA